ncbi:hypothetical protein G7Y89_g7326 [Cudoniella acicularis]|uniref:Dynein light chain n=1 Tax=Cudoniella acicularis TaxID=354080 RepID=A0A8H4W270_9HELO|nr:hypothetical protein G7Y89_g7326 [Cudoniella acicularis]
MRDPSPTQSGGGVLQITITYLDESIQTNSNSHNKFTKAALSRTKAYQNLFRLGQGHSNRSTGTQTTSNPLSTKLNPGQLHKRLFDLYDTETMASSEKEVGQLKEKLEAQIKSADMTDDMQQEAIDVAQEGMSKYTIEKDIAQFIKKTFDERKGPTWHCIVGRNFGSFVTHETKHFIYFYLGHCAILLFKTQ